MFSGRLRVLLSSLVIVGALITVAGATYALTRADTIGTGATDVWRKTTANKFINMNGPVKITVLSVHLPAGSWVISGNTTAIDGPPLGPGGWVRCGIYKGSTELDAVAGNLDSQTSAVLAPTGAVHSSAAFTAALKCWEDFGSSDPNYIDAGATLWAHKAKSLNTH